MTSDSKDAERLAALMQYYATVKPVMDWKGESEGRFLLRQIARLTQERDSYKQASLDCHDALGKCAVERDTANRRVEALEAEVGRLRELMPVVDGVLLDAPSEPSLALRALLTSPSPWDAASPAADHTERAREDEGSKQFIGPLKGTPSVRAFAAEWAKDFCAACPELPAGSAQIIERLLAEFAATLTAAERAGAEKMRSLDEAVIKAAHKLEFGAYPAHGSGFVLIVTGGNIDDLKAALAARDAATDGEGR